ATRRSRTRRPPSTVRPAPAPMGTALRAGGCPVSSPETARSSLRKAKAPSGPPWFCRTPRGDGSSIEKKFRIQLGQVQDARGCHSRRAPRCAAARDMKRNIKVLVGSAVFLAAVVVVLLRHLDLRKEMLKQAFPTDYFEAEAALPDLFESINQNVYSFRKGMSRGLIIDTEQGLAVFDTFS